MGRNPLRVHGRRARNLRAGSQICEPEGVEITTAGRAIVAATPDTALRHFFATSGEALRQGDIRITAAASADSSDHDCDLWSCQNQGAVW